MKNAIDCKTADLLKNMDFSSLELRVLAHAAQTIPLDIHNQTACEMFAVTPPEVTPTMRMYAKLSNYREWCYRKPR